MLKALQAIDGVRVFHCELQPSKLPDIKWPTKKGVPGISTLSSFQYGKENVKVWKAYDIGSGKSIKLDQVDIKKTAKLKIVATANEHATFIPVKHHKTQENTTGDTVFHCPDASCSATFATFGDLEVHLDGEEHHIGLEIATTLDRAKMKYAAKLHEGGAHLEEVQSHYVEHAETDETGDTELEMGFALGK